jgi:hypothetical protein
VVTRRGEFPATIRVECPNCGQLSPVALRSAEGSSAEYEDFCEGEPRGGSPCGTALLVTATRTEDLEAFEDIQEE